MNEVVVWARLHRRWSQSEPMSLERAELLISACRLAGPGTLARRVEFRVFESPRSRLARARRAGHVSGGGCSCFDCVMARLG